MVFFSQEGVAEVFQSGCRHVGIGKFTAFEFAKEGARVVITYYNDKEAANKVAVRCKELGAKEVLVSNLNVMDDSSIKKSVDSFFIVI